MTDPPPLGAPYCHKRTARAIAGRSRSHAVRSRRISRMRSPACRTENRPGVRFCEECGATLDVLRSEEHTSELQSRLHLVCRLLLEKKKSKKMKKSRLVVKMNRC